MSLERPETLEEKSYAAYRLACYKARKKGNSEPDRAEYTARYLAKHSQKAACSVDSAPIPAPEVSAQPPAMQAPLLGQNSQVETETVLGKQETEQTAECRDIAVVTPRPPEMSLPTPAPARAVTRLANGQFPKRAPLCKAATPAQFVKAVELMAEGCTFAVIRNAVGADWQAINEYGMAEYPMEWPAVNQAWRESRALALVDKATDIAMQTAPASVSETEGAMGRSVTRLHKTDPGMLTAALAGLLPQIHGRAAGRGTINVTANNAAIFGPPPVGSLDSWIPDGLTP